MQPIPCCDAPNYSEFCFALVYNDWTIKTVKSRGIVSVKTARTQKYYDGEEPTTHKGQLITLVTDTYLVQLGPEQLTGRQ